MDYSLAGSSVHGISQVRILEWVVISLDGRVKYFKDVNFSQINFYQYYFSENLSLGCNLIKEF